MKSSVSEQCTVEKIGVERDLLLLPPPLFLRGSHWGQIDRLAGQLSWFHPPTLSPQPQRLGGLEGPIRLPQWRPPPSIRSFLSLTPATPWLSGWRDQFNEAQGEGSPITNPQPTQSGWSSDRLIWNSLFLIS